MRYDIGGHETGEARVLALAALDTVADRLLGLELGQREAGANALNLLSRQAERLGIAGGKLGLDRLAQRLDAFLVHEDLDARLELVVSPALHIVDAQDRLDIAQ